MPLLANCPQCSSKYNIPDTLLDKLVRCRECKTAFRPAAPTPAYPAPVVVRLRRLSLLDLAGRPGRPLEDEE